LSHHPFAMTFPYQFVAVSLATPRWLQESQLHLDLFVSKVSARLKHRLWCEANFFPICNGDIASIVSVHCCLSHSNGGQSGLLRQSGHKLLKALRADP